MNRVFIRGITLPGRVRGVTVKDEDDDYNIYINTVLCPEAQQRAIDHEIRHISRDHFFDDAPVICNEWEANL